MMEKSLILIIVLFIAFLLYINNNTNNDLNKAVKTLTRQAARWATAAKQDQNPLIAILHANYGAGYLWAINDIVTSDQFNSITGLDYTQFKDEITQIQDDATRKMTAVCPQFAPEKSYLTFVSAE
jgi:hypothetical protein